MVHVSAQSQCTFQTSNLAVGTLHHHLYIAQFLLYGLGVEVPCPRNPLTPVDEGDLGVLLTHHGTFERSSLPPLPPLPPGNEHQRSSPRPQRSGRRGHAESTGTTVCEQGGPVRNHVPDPVGARRRTRRARGNAPHVRGYQHAEVYDHPPTREGLVRDPVMRGKLVQARALHPATELLDPSGESKEARGMRRLHEGEWRLGPSP